MSLTVLWGCPERPSAPDAGVGDAGAVVVVDAGPPAIPTLELQITGALTDGGIQVLPLVPGERPLLPPLTSLELTASFVPRDLRIRLFDEADRAMVSDDESDDSGPGLRYRIVLPSPLKTGHRYTLVLDAQTGAAMLDPQGRPMPDQRLEFQIAGEKEKPVKPPKPGKRKKRR